MIENRGRIFPERTFEYMVKYQHFGYLEKLKVCINSWLDDDHPLVSYERLLRKLPTPSQDKIDQISRIPLFQSFTKFPSLQEVEEALPMNSAMITLSYSVNKNAMYFGWRSKVSSSDSSKAPTTQFLVRKIELSNEVKAQLQEVVGEFDSIQAALGKTPINDEDKFKVLLADLEIRA